MDASQVRVHDKYVFKRLGVRGNYAGIGQEAQDAWQELHSYFKGKLTAINSQVPTDEQILAAIDVAEQEYLYIANFNNALVRRGTQG